MERDRKKIEYNTKYNNFNSHAHVERDEAVNKRLAEVYDFNSHAHVERDLLKIIKNCQLILFQLTRSRGA